MKKIFSIIILILISTLSLETLLGYYYYQKRQVSKCSSIATTIRWVSRRLSSNLEQPHRDQILINSQETNPFLDYDKSVGYKFHPFIDYSGVMTSYPDQTTLDYFGFRNDTNLYFDEDHDYILIVMTGGSEAAGSGHRITIAKNIEKILNKKGHRKYKVLNLAMNSYTVPNEINAYVHLAYRLKPEFVISHSGWNDLYAGQRVPYNFKRLGLHYMKNQEFWLPRLYKLQNVTIKSEDVVALVDPEANYLIVENYLKNLKKYREVVIGNGGKFIVGLQKYQKVALPEYDGSYRLYPDLIKRIHRENEFKDRLIDFTQNEKLSMYNPTDPVHTSEKSSLLIAKMYAERILSEEKDRTKIR